MSQHRVVTNVINAPGRREKTDLYRAGAAGGAQQISVVVGPTVSSASLLSSTPQLQLFSPCLNPASPPSLTRITTLAT